MSDVVEHPPHYVAHASGTECIDVVEHMSFCVGNGVKYCWRQGKKGPALEDLRKAAWYFRRAIDRVEMECNSGFDRVLEHEPEGSLLGDVLRALKGYYGVHIPAIKALVRVEAEIARLT